MLVVWLMFMQVVVVVGQGNQLPLFDPVTCHNMCKVKDDCPNNAACMPIVGSDKCGVCVCVFGFVPDSGRCGSRSTSGSNPSVGVTLEDLDPTRSISVRSQSNPSSWDCSQYECNKAAPTNPNQPFQITPVLADKEGIPCGGTTKIVMYRTETIIGCSVESFEKTTPCRNQKGGSQCGGGGECIYIDSTVSYCICPYQRAGLSCQTEKPNTCRLADGNHIPESKVKGKRYRHIREPDVGSIYARHFADNYDHCVRLCQWAGTSRCRSINFGRVHGRNVCELLTVWAHSSSPLHRWLDVDSSWTYTCCFRSKQQEN